MSDLIRCRRVVTTSQSSEPPASAATAPALMDHLAIGPVGSQVPASLASSVAQPVSTSRRHWPPNATETTSTYASGQEEHPRAVSVVEDGEGHPSDQQSYQHRIRRATSSCTYGGVA
ncbi:unnamed protein product [Prunus armeniaca]